MTGKIQKFSLGIGFLLVFIAIFLFWAIGFPHALSYQEQYQLFLSIIMVLQKKEKKQFGMDMHRILTLLQMKKRSMFIIIKMKMEGISKEVSQVKIQLYMKMKNVKTLQL